MECLAYTALDMSGSDIAEHVELARSHISRCSLSKRRFDRTSIIDCSLETCDLSNLEMVESSWSRVEVTDSRITGMTIANGTLRDVTAAGCQGPHSSFRFSTLRDVRFTNCVLRGADFLQCAFDGVVFDGCELDGAQFSGVRVSRARFTNCTLSGIGGVTSLAGAVISEADLAGLAGVLASAVGIVVEKAD